MYCIGFKRLHRHGKMWPSPRGGEHSRSIN